jgi:hypothetical protein
LDFSHVFHHNHFILEFMKWKVRHQMVTRAALFPYDVHHDRLLNIRVHLFLRSQVEFVLYPGLVTQTHYSVFVRQKAQAWESIDSGSSTDLYFRANEFVICVKKIPSSSACMMSTPLMRSTCIDTILMMYLSPSLKPESRSRKG